MRANRLAPAVFAALVVVSLSTAVAVAWGWPYRARLLPLAIGIPTLGLASLQLLRALYGMLHPSSGVGASALVIDIPVDRSIPTATMVRRAADAFAWVFGLLLAIVLFGFLVAVPVFVFAYLLLRAREQLRQVLIGGALVTALLFGVFEWLLRVPWPRPVFPILQELALRLVGSS